MFLHSWPSSLICNPHIIYQQFLLHNFQYTNFHQYLALTSPQRNLDPLNTYQQNMYISNQQSQNNSYKNHSQKPFLPMLHDPQPVLCDPPKGCDPLVGNPRLWSSATVSWMLAPEWAAFQPYQTRYQNIELSSKTLRIGHAVWLDW